MIEELNKLEKQYMSLFTGREVKIKKTYNVDIIPEKNQKDSLKYLFSFSENEGIYFDNRLSGELNVILKKIKVFHKVTEVFYTEFLLMLILK